MSNPMVWTSTPPSKPGWYWYTPRYKINGPNARYAYSEYDTRIVRLREKYSIRPRAMLLELDNCFAGKWPDGYVRILNGGEWRKWTGRWSGPIPEPEVAE